MAGKFNDGKTVKILDVVVSRIETILRTSGTPISTSYASNKWWFAVGRLPFRQTDDSSTGTQATASALVFSYVLGDGPLFVFNDTQYIEYLNKGSSQQAPAMFVEKATDEMVREINRKYESKVVIL